MVNARRDAYNYPMRRCALVIIASFLAAWLSPARAEYSHVQLATSGDPSSFSNHSAIHDPVGDRIIVFGGADELCSPHSRLAALDLSTNAWTTLAPAGPTPPARSRHQAVYDSQLHRMIVYGGDGAAFGLLADLWALTLSDLPTWSEIVPVNVGPGTRWLPSLMLDPIRNRLILHGGDDGNDTWVLPLSGTPEWVELATAGEQPPARRGHAAFYDAALDRMIVVGGYGHSIADSYALDLASMTWARIETARSAPIPPLQWWAPWAFDASRRRLVSWSPSPVPYQGMEAHVLDLSGDPVCYVEPADSPAYHGDNGWSLTWDPVRDRILVHGGDSFHHGCSISPITSALEWTVGAAGFDLSAPGGIEWNGESTQEIVYVAHNSTSDLLALDWTLESDETVFALPVLGSVIVAAQATVGIPVTFGILGPLPKFSRLTFRSHPPGEPGMEEICTHEFWSTFPTSVPGPTESSFDVSPARPNPGRGAVSWTVTLDSPERVSLAILDIGGREVWRSPETDHPRGSVVMTWSGATRWGALAAPGIYYARIQSSSGAVVRRFVTIR